MLYKPHEIYSTEWIDRSELIEELFRSDCSTRKNIEDIVRHQSIFLPSRENLIPVQYVENYIAKLINSRNGFKKDSSSWRWYDEAAQIIDIMLLSYKKDCEEAERNGFI